jgi:4-hydroxybutyryl-CoA dehydratase / vinylacetyl-CoA-Delta-isomerase
MALLSAKDAVAAINPAYAANIEAVYKYARAHDLRAAALIRAKTGGAFISATGVPSH